MKLSGNLCANLCAMPLLDDCRNLVSQMGQVRISHCFREANSCADFLARLETHQDSCFVLHHDPPVDLLGMLNSDSSLSLMQVPFYQKNKEEIIR